MHKRIHGNLILTENMHGRKLYEEVELLAYGVLCLRSPSLLSAPNQNKKATQATELQKMKVI